MDDDKPTTITLDPSYTTYGAGSTTTSTITLNGHDGSMSDDYVSDINSGTFTINTGSLNTGTDMEWEYDSNITVPEDADIKIGNRSLKTFMDTMEKRMAILQPDPKKLEKFEALQKAYEHYKHLERLCELDDEDEKKGPNF